MFSNTFNYIEEKEKPIDFLEILLNYEDKILNKTFKKS